MGFIDNLRSLVKGVGNEEVEEVQKEDPYEKSRLASEIVSLVQKISKINSFDTSIRSLTDISSYDLKKKSLPELQQLKDTLNSRLSAIDKQSQRSGQTRNDLQEAAWTGRKPAGMTDHDFDRYQSHDDR